MPLISSLSVSSTVSIFPPVILLKNDVFINCKVTPRPYEATVQWMLNNRPFIPQHGIPSNSPATQSVLWEEATTGLAGNWTCTVGYGGREGRASATLALTGKTRGKGMRTELK